MRLRHSRQNEQGAALPELMIAALVIGVFFASIFEVSGLCLRYISASKENMSAIECVQDRIEQLRNTDFNSLLDPNYLINVPAVPPALPAPSPPQRRNLTVPANASELATQATETVTISAYNGTAVTTPSVTYTRLKGAGINTATNFADNNSPAPTKVWTPAGTTSFPSTTTAVQVEVTYAWNSTLGGRARSETSATLVTAGTKK